MTTRHVDVHALNLRSEPQISPHNRIAVLHLGDAVECVGEPVEGWQRLQVMIDDRLTDGFVKRDLAGAGGEGQSIDSLRDSASTQREALVAQACLQWKRFRYGTARETDAPWHEYIGEMWRAIGESHDGLDTDIPWSAAAISFMVRSAGAAMPRYLGFRFAASHSRYVNDAIRRQGQDQAPFWGVRIAAARPQVGDLVARWREVPISFDYAAENAAFKSHVDVVVSVGAEHVLAIGGNVSDSVGLTRYRCSGGFLTDDNGVFALLRNND